MTRLVFELTHHVDSGRPVVELVRPITLQGYDVPAGFRTDFASIPRPLWIAFPVFGRSARAAVLHDWLCYLQEPRAPRSALFLRQMIEDGVPRWQAWLQYLAVRWWPGAETVTGERHIREITRPI